MLNIFLVKIQAPASIRADYFRACTKWIHENILSTDRRLDELMLSLVSLILGLKMCVFLFAFCLVCFFIFFVDFRGWFCLILNVYTLNNAVLLRLEEETESIVQFTLFFGCFFHWLSQLAWSADWNAYSRMAYCVMSHVSC